MNGRLSGVTFNTGVETFPLMMIGRLTGRALNTGDETLSRGIIGFPFGSPSADTRAMGCFLTFSDTI